jgi:hypothetical protein
MKPRYFTCNGEACAACVLVIDHDTARVPERCPWNHEKKLWKDSEFASFMMKDQAYFVCRSCSSPCVIVIDKHLTGSLPPDHCPWGGSDDDTKWKREEP